MTYNRLETYRPIMPFCLGGEINLYMLFAKPFVKEFRLLQWKVLYR